MPHHRIKARIKTNVTPIPKSKLKDFKVKYSKGNKIYTSVKLQSISRCIQNSVEEINHSVLQFGKLPNKTKIPEMKSILSDIRSQHKDISKYKNLLQREIVPILTDFTSQYVHSRLIHSNVIPPSMSGCVVTHESSNDKLPSILTRIPKHEKETCRLETIPLPANGSQYTPLELIEMISNYKGIKKFLIKKIIERKYVPVKEASIHRLMQKYRNFGTYNREWNVSGR